MVTLLLGLVLLGVVCWVTTQSALTAYRYQRVSVVMLFALWPAMLLIPTGLALMAVAMLATLGRQLRAALGPRAGRDEVDEAEARGVSEALAGTVLLALLFLFFSLGLEIAFSLGLVGLVGLLWLKGWTVGLGVVGSVAWSNASSFSFVAVPLFVFMSAILLHSGIGQSLYAAVARWVGFLPGGLAVASVFACAIFAAVSGSSVATAATIGMIAIPEMESRGYHKPLIYGSLAAGGTLGILIPPSVPMIIFGVMTETSVGQLYMAGILPGILLALLFAAYIVGYAMLYPGRAPRGSEGRRPAAREAAVARRGGAHRAAHRGGAGLDVLRHRDPDRGGRARRVDEPRARRHGRATCGGPGSDGPSTRRSAPPR